MRPAFSLIVFTALSGMGFGLVAMLGFGIFRADSMLWWLIANVAALGFIGAGVLASVFHLGNPGRAWRAFSQWRSSWLSREGVLAALVSCGLLAWMAAGFFAGRGGAVFVLSGTALAALSLITVFATAMIYASLKTVARWHHPLTPILFLLYAIAGGLMLTALLTAMATGKAGMHGDIAAAAMLIALIATIIWNALAGRKRNISTRETATGLGNFGKVSMLMPPHTEENWLQHEMGFIVARKHAKTIRIIGYVCMLTACVIAAVFDSALFMFCATLLHLIAVMISRWLFFAEARHTMMLYY